MRALSIALLVGAAAMLVSASGAVLLASGVSVADGVSDSVEASELGALVGAEETSSRLVLGAETTGADPVDLTLGTGAGVLVSAGTLGAGTLGIDSLASSVGIEDGCPVPVGTLPPSQSVTVTVMTSIPWRKSQKPTFLMY